MLMNRYAGSLEATRARRQTDIDAQTSPFMVHAGRSTTCRASPPNEPSRQRHRSAPLCKETALKTPRIMLHHVPRLWAVALVFLPAAAATPAMADMTAVYVENDGDLFTVEISGNGDVRAQHSDEAYAILIRQGEAYMVRPPTGKGQAFRVADLVGLRGGPAPPPKVSYKREALGERIVGRWRGDAYAMHARTERAQQAEIIVLSNESKLKPLGRAVRRLLDGFFLPVALTMEQDSAPAIYAFQAMTEGIGRRTPLIWSGMTLQSVSHQDISDTRFALPAMADKGDD